MRLAFAVLLSCFALPAIAQNPEGGGWRLISVGGIAADPGGRIAFGADGSVFGSTGCNRFQTSVVAAPGVLTFAEAAASTKMACDEALADQETKVLSALKGTVAVAYDPVSERMMLIPQEGAPILGFARGG